MIILYDQVGKKTPETVGLAEALAKQSGEQVTSYCLADLDIAIEAGKPVLITLDGTDIAAFGTVYFRTIARSRDIAAIVADYLQDKGIHFVDSEVALVTAQSKLHQMYLLHKAGLPIADTYYGSQSFIGAQLSPPFIYKATVASKGEDNHLIMSYEQFADIDHVGKRFIAQKYVKNTGDYRFLVFGNAVQLTIKRTANEGTHLNNTSQGGSAKLVEADPELAALAVEAATLFNREVAGVDIMLGEDGQPYLLEVNRTPQLATGAFVDEKIKLFTQYLQGL